MHHRQTIQAYLGYRRTRREGLERLAACLLERALEHESPTLLYALACEQLQRPAARPPGGDPLERLVAETRQSAQAETFRRLGPILTEDCQHRRRIRRGSTEPAFALFDLLGLQFAPRLRDIGDQQLYRMTRDQRVRHLAPRFKGTIRQEFILHVIGMTCSGWPGRSRAAG